MCGPLEVMCCLFNSVHDLVYPDWMGVPVTGEILVAIITQLYKLQTESVITGLWFDHVDHGIP